jgi:hypothetical protein
MDQMIVKLGLASLGLVLISAAPAQASDTWGSCTAGALTIDFGGNELKDGTLTSTTEESEISGQFKVIRTVELGRESETCRLNGPKGQRVVSLDVTYFSALIEYATEGTTRRQFFLCEQGGSGIPASASCYEPSVRRKPLK